MEKTRKKKQIINDGSELIAGRINRAEECCSNPYDEKEYAKMEVNNDFVFGSWKSSEEVATSIWSSIHYSLLEGNLVFAYRSIGSEHFQIVIVKDRSNNELDTFSIGMMNDKYTALLPNMPYEYLAEIVVNDLSNNKVEKNIIEIYKQIIKKFERK